jgi:hypothetical protein
MREKDVLRVDQSLINTIYENTSGKPLLASLIADTLYHRFNDFCEVRDKMLYLKKSKKGAENELVAMNVTAIVQSQFDRYDNGANEVQSAHIHSFIQKNKINRLHPAFQKILKLASFFSQYFNLIDVATMLPDSCGPTELVEAIAKHDIYNYLIRQPATSTVINDEQEDAAEGAELQEFEYYFRHITICNCIYESQPFVERLATHLKIAEYFEEMLNQENWNELVPIVCHHYSKSNNLPKTVFFLEQLGYVLMAKILRRFGKHK